MLVLLPASSGVSAGQATYAGDDPRRPGQFEHHPDIAIELWAAEPAVTDPVAISFAADGTCYVAEMRDYPYGVGPDRRPGDPVLVRHGAGIADLHRGQRGSPGDSLRDGRLG